MVFSSCTNEISSANFDLNMLQTKLQRQQSGAWLIYWSNKFEF